MPQHYGFRFSDDLAEKLNSYANRYKLSRSEALMQLLASALENTPVEPVEFVEQTEQIQELITTAVNKVKYSLEGEIEALKAKTIALENMTVQPVKQIEQVEEIVDNKTAYIAIAVNEIKHTLEDELEALKAKFEGLETRLGEY